ncbi:MAG TPA: enoyl-CoA hydratase-related protein, partial [Novosphingobium sp.]|nr:enoyl-CoA hydratase-related protein [Novosphingobium sp.]
MTHPTADSTLASAEETILLERPAPHVALVRLNRPARRNAINGAMARAIEAHVQAIEADTDIRVALIAAAPGPTFCAGADLAEAAAGRGHELMTAAGGFAGFVEAPRRKPWIAAISGSALGGGLEIALSCDMIVCAESSVLGLPEVKRGLIAGAGGLFRL